MNDFIEMKVVSPKVLMLKNKKTNVITLFECMCENIKSLDKLFMSFNTNSFINIKVKLNKMSKDERNNYIKENS